MTRGELGSRLFWGSREHKLCDVSSLHDANGRGLSERRYLYTDILFAGSDQGAAPPDVQRAG
jgi:hypothetical protein